MLDRCDLGGKLFYNEYDETLRTATTLGGGLETTRLIYKPHSCIQTCVLTFSSYCKYLYVHVYKFTYIQGVHVGLSGNMHVLGVCLFLEVTSPLAFYDQMPFVVTWVQAYKKKDFGCTGWIPNIRCTA